MITATRSNTFLHLYGLLKSLWVVFFSIPPVVQNRKSDKENLVMIDTEREFIEQSDSLKILYLNAQSLRNIATLLNDMIHELNIDIAFFTESWLKSSEDEVIIQNLTPEGFKAVSFHHESGHGEAFVLSIENL